MRRLTHESLCDTFGGSLSARQISTKYKSAPFSDDGLLIMVITISTVLNSDILTRKHIEAFNRAPCYLYGNTPIELMTYFYVIWPPTQPNPPPHPSIPNHLFAFLLRKKAVDGKNAQILT